MAWLDPPNHPDAIIPDWDCIFRKRGAREDGRVKPIARPADLNQSHVAAAAGGRRR
jgi:hypothetical protein